MDYTHVFFKERFYFKNLPNIAKKSMENKMLQQYSRLNVDDYMTCKSHNHHAVLTVHNEYGK